MIDKEKILNLYFIKKCKQVEIVRLLNISKSTINRIIIADERYLEEKMRRQNANKAKNKTDTINYITQKRRSTGGDIIYEALKKQHQEDIRELSGGRKPISNRIYRDWNTSVYQYNKNSNCYVLKKGIIAGSDIPEKINWKGF